MSKTNDVRSLNVRQYTGGNPEFLRCCEKAKVPPTARQWRKWNDQRGAAYKAK